MKFNKILLLLLIAMALAFSIIPSFAYSYSGKRWWGTTQYTKYDSSVPNSWIDNGALYGARKAWNDSGSRFRLYHDNSSLNIVKAGQYGTTGWLAQATVWTNIIGYISKAEVKFNLSYPWSVTGTAGTYDVQNIAAHEFGHWLQLNDLYSATDSYKTMYGYAAKGETVKRTLHSDDISGIKHIYGQ